MQNCGGEIPILDKIHTSLAECRTMPCLTGKSCIGFVWPTVLWTRLVRVYDVILTSIGQRSRTSSRWCCIFVRQGKWIVIWSGKWMDAFSNKYYLQPQGASPEWHLWKRWLLRRTELRPITCKVLRPNGHMEGTPKYPVHQVVSEKEKPSWKKPTRLRNQTSR